MTEFSYLSYALAVMGLSLKPGPGLAIMLGIGLRNGAGKVVVYFAGAAIVEALYLAVAIYSISFMTTVAEQASTWINLAAILMLGYLGLDALLRRDETPAKNEYDKSASAAVIFSTGFLATLGNPLIIAFFAGIVPLLVPAGGVSFTVYLTALTITLTIELGIAIAYLLPMILLRRHLEAKIAGWLHILSGLIMFLLAAYLAYKTLFPGVSSPLSA